MHQTRAEVTTKIPIPRKGTKYIARPMSHVKNSVPVVIAVRDMLNLAKTTKEVQKMIHQKLLKLNGREVKEHRDSIKLFNIFEAGKKYILTLNQIGKFKLEEFSGKDRMCKVINKKILSGNKSQLNLHDGSNIITKDKIATQDTIYLDFAGKITKHVSLEKGKNCFIISGKYLGKEGKIESTENGKAKIKLEGKTVELEKRSIVAI